MAGPTRGFSGGLPEGVSGGALLLGRQVHRQRVDALLLPRQQPCRCFPAGPGRKGGGSPGFQLPWHGNRCCVRSGGTKRGAGDPGRRLYCTKTRGAWKRHSKAASNLLIPACLEVYGVLASSDAHRPHALGCKGVRKRAGATSRWMPAGMSGSMRGLSVAKAPAHLLLCADYRALLRHGVAGGVPAIVAGRVE